MAVFSCSSFGSMFNSPSGITLNHQTGNIIISENHRIQVFSPSGEFLFSFGSSGYGEGQFMYPESVICDRTGRIFVCDCGNDRIQIFSPFGEFLSSFGSSGDREGQFHSPNGIAYDNNRGNIIISDSENHRIQVFSPSGEFLFSFGSFGEEEGEFNYPAGLACDHTGNIFVCDNGNNRIQVFSPFGEFISSFGITGTEEGQFYSPENITIDSSSGNIVVSDTLNHRIQVFRIEPMAPIGLQSKFSSEFKFLFSFGSFGEEGQFRFPREVMVNHDGDYVVCDSYNDQILIFRREIPSLFSLCWNQIEEH
jgi:tripartite motif-containing protein 71